jgi:hypothetical protein
MSIYLVPSGSISQTSEFVRREPDYNGRDYYVTLRQPLPHPIMRYIEIAQNCPYIIIGTVTPNGTPVVSATISKHRFGPVIPFDRPEIMVPLSNNYPVITFRYAIIPVTVFDDSSHIMITSYRKRSIISPKSSTIPSRMFQTFETLVVPVNLKLAMDGWIKMYPHFSHYYYTSLESERFIASHFEPRVLQAYRDLYAGAFKADLWRVCQLYINGGMYVDAKMYSVTSLQPLLDTHDLILAIDINPTMIYNAFMAVRPRHPLMKLIINKIVNNVEKRSYGNTTSALGITGPLTVGDCLREYLGVSQFTIGSHVHSDGTRYCLLKHRFVFLLTNCRGICDNESDYLYARHPTNPVNDKECYRATGKPHYGHLHYMKKIYRDEHSS